MGVLPKGKSNKGPSINGESCWKCLCRAEVSNVSFNLSSCLDKVKNHKKEKGFHNEEVIFPGLKKYSLQLNHSCQCVASRFHDVLNLIKT